MKKTKVQDRATDTLQTELGALKAEYNRRSIEFKNSKGEVRELAYNRVDRNGAFVGDRETEMSQWDAYVAVAFKAQHEQKKSVNAGEGNLAVKAGHSIKQGVASCNVRTSRMVAKGAAVTVALAHAQRMAKDIRDIETELTARTEEKQKADAELAAALMSRPMHQTVVAAAA